MKNERERIAALQGVNLRHDHRNQRRMRVREMAHVRVIDVTSDEPAHGTASHNIRSEVFLRRDSRCAHYSGQAVRSNADDFLVLEFMIEQ